MKEINKVIIIVTELFMLFLVRKVNLRMMAKKQIAAIVILSPLFYFNAIGQKHHDVLAIFEGNYMSNIAPQLHNGLNDSGGVWIKAERWVQDCIVKTGHEV